ncbi:MAG: DUF997 family protein [Planctomycetaceae bacterium]|nr:DUF997 family protein [Planctomycetaceae bacterium]
MHEPESPRSDRPDDPVYLHARREALVILALWAAAMLWVVPYSYFFGYHEITDPEQIKTIVGIPDWVFWGVLVPWIVCTLATIALCVWYIKDEDLEGIETPAR